MVISTDINFGCHVRFLANCLCIQIFDETNNFGYNHVIRETDCTELFDELLFQLIYFLLTDNTNLLQIQFLL